VYGHAPVIRIHLPRGPVCRGSFRTAIMSTVHVRGPLPLRSSASRHFQEERLFPVRQSNYAFKRTAGTVHGVS
jgi:hypothetical protein